MFKHKKLLFMGIASAFFSHSIQSGITNSIQSGIANSINRKNLTLLIAALAGGEAAIAPMVLVASSKNKPLLKKAKKVLMDSRHSLERSLKSKVINKQQITQLVHDIKARLTGLIEEFKGIISSKKTSYLYKKSMKKIMKIFVNIVDHSLEKVIKEMSH